MPRKGRKRPPLKIVIPLLAWDLAWRALAIRRAIQIGDRKQVVPLLFANSLGLWPMFYLWQKRNALPREAWGAVQGR
jgi:hypothetical protein